MSETILVDTNVFLRHLLQDIPDQSARSSELMRLAKVGDVTLYTPSTVYFELVYYLHKTLGISREAVAEALLDLLSFTGLTVDHPEALTEALTFWVQHRTLSFADCFHLALAGSSGMTRIYTFDQKMSRYPGVQRIEP